jgi:NADPH:quinone reductase-like Zn-dependent oxidoreductase
VKAVVYTEYGPPDVLRFTDVDTPVPGDGEVLVKVRAVSLNLSDWEALRGTPLYSRIGGLRRPRRHVLGSDIAGRVEAVGPGANRFRPGDDVFADILDHLGGFAEYVRLPETVLEPMPAGMTHEQAAALPQAGAIALQGIRDRGRVRPGHRVLINGAGGGSGTFAIQLAKLDGAEVTGVDNAEKQDFMREMGADHVWTTGRSTTPAPASGTTSSSTWPRTARRSPTGGRLRAAGATCSSADRWRRCCRCSSSGR